MAEERQETDLGKARKPRLTKPKTNWRYIVVLPLWTYGAFLAGSFLVAGLLWAVDWAGIPLRLVNQTVLTTTLSVMTYIFAIAIVIGVPLLIWKKRTKLKELGISDWLSWMDIFLSLPAYFVYMVVVALLVMGITSVAPDLIDFEQAQVLPFDKAFFYTKAQYMMIFFTLVILAPLAEELLFRGYLFGKLKKAGPVWLAIFVSALGFGLAHLWTGSGGALQWAVVIDTFVLGLVLAGLRASTGAIWAGVMVHAIKNGIAFYFLFLNPSFIDQLKVSIILLT